MKRNHLAPVSTTNSVSLLRIRKRGRRGREEEPFLCVSSSQWILSSSSSSVPFSTPFPILDRVQVFSFLFFFLSSFLFFPSTPSLSVTVITVIMDHEEEEEKEEEEGRTEKSLDWCEVGGGERRKYENLQKVPFSLPAQLSHCKERHPANFIPFSLAVRSCHSKNSLLLSWIRRPKLFFFLLLATSLSSSPFPPLLRRK